MEQIDIWRTASALVRQHGDSAREHAEKRAGELLEQGACPRGQSPLTERQLANLKRGEIRWSERESGWEVLIPAVAFKNANSSYFGGGKHDENLIQALPLSTRRHPAAVWL